MRGQEMAKILAVDDEKDILVLIQNILRRDQHQVDILDRVKGQCLTYFKDMI